MLKIKTPKTQRAKREVENGRKTLILHGTKTSDVLNTVLTQIYHLKRDNAVKYTKKNENIRPFESGGETSLEFFSLKTDCSLFVTKQFGFGMFDHHIYDLVEVGVDNFRPMESFEYDKKLTPRIGSKPFFAFVGDGFESVEELKHLKEVLLDLFRGEVGCGKLKSCRHRPCVCMHSPLFKYSVFHSLCSAAEKSGTAIPRMELVEVGPSMDLVVRRHRLPNDSLKKEAMKTTTGQPKKKIKNVSSDVLQGKIGKIYIPDQKVGGIALSNDAKGLKRERREAKKTAKAVGENEAKKRKTASK
ncbi:TVP38 TMEM64 family membrane protein [Musa troglodytarum]|uniref:Ribosome production factor 2 homolog n=1 Tax=Musa troglodytarum TaxID=320322 RepID=A0A9E7EKE2_9LILI|nr:TVP38 TMEM64 family membrane protein [Musa troglodytarum]URD79138.1 TVP38 TMEM64 family membrane protein [Musa troglodytarum]